MIEHFGSVLRGEKSLARTYWLYYVGLSILSNIVLVGTNLAAARLVLFSKPLFYGLLYGSFIFAVIVALTMGYAVFKVVAKRSTPGLWGVLACILVIAGIGKSFYYIYQSVVPGALTETEIQKSLSLQSAGLPLVIQEGLVFTSMTLNNKTMRYTYELDAKILPPPVQDTIQSGAFDTCSDIKSFLDSDAVDMIKFDYSHNGKTYTATLVKGDCD